MSETLTLVAPLCGWAQSLAETPDPVFAEKMLGDGLAIDPTVGELRAPCDAEVIGLHACSHAVTLRAANGAEILLHVGLETVRCGGSGFAPRTAIGEQVATGDLLLTFDLELLARNAASLVSPVVVINSARFAVEPLASGREVRFGEPVLSVRAQGAATAEATAAPAEWVRRRVKVGLAHGLHARPAALVAREAANFAAEIALEAGERRANARSPVSVMALGVGFGDEIELVASGVDAVAALAALAARIAEDLVAPPALVAAEPPPPAEDRGGLAGVPAAPGLAIGAAVRLIEPEVGIVETAGAPEAEHAALADALDAVKAALTDRLAGEAAERREILEAHLAFLADPELRQTAAGAIAGGRSAGAAWAVAIGGYVDQLRGAADARMVERAADLADLRRQVLLRLADEAAPALRLPDNAVILADDILPSQLLELDPARVAGLAIARGGPTSHVAILAASMNIPAVVALGASVLRIEDGALVILDGDAGRLLVAPNPAEIAAAQTRLAERRSRRAQALAVAAEPCRTVDGARIEVFANLAAVDEAAEAVANGAEGCGLLRTEFLFMDRDAPPDEDEQTAAYEAIAAALGERPLVIRTLDVGADKPAPYLPLAAEENPALGVRGVRVSLAYPALLRTQLRAILRVRPLDGVQIMLPMVVGLAEVRAVRAVLVELAAELGVVAPKLGVMVETPAAAILADVLAAEADFLSIGTNDLAQYTLAMDRTNPRLAAQVDALHPAVLRLVQAAAGGGARHRRPVSVCGGLASEIAAAPILIGLGATELSAAPAAVPELKAAIRALTLAQCRDLAERALAQASAAEVRALRLARGVTPELGAVS
ncbi:MAG TPA: phosphoenolpyruvate--protein phosphotransferase [Caulobacteraceae bacterium]|nr:phosphoenolpyruvate--protein phosphotransferase [Caulobacteraceae bacterium]